MECFQDIEGQYFKIQRPGGFHGGLLRHTARDELTQDFSNIDGTNGGSGHGLLKPVRTTLVLEYRENGGGIQQIKGVTHTRPLDAFP
jgi:hypothetical protein